MRTSASNLALTYSASEEMDSSKNHMIVDDGYNRGRNYIVDRATEGSHWRGMWWKADVEWREGLLERGKRGRFDLLPSHSLRLTFVGQVSTMASSRTASSRS